MILPEVGAFDAGDPVKLDFSEPIDSSSFEVRVWQTQLDEELEIPEEHLAEAQVRRMEMVEAAAEFDEELLDLFVEDEDCTEELVLKALREGTLQMELTPVYVGSALKHKGVRFLLDGVIDLLPSPLDIPPVQGIHPDSDEPCERQPDIDAPLSLMVFKTIAEQSGDLTFVRVYSGKLEKGSKLLNPRTGKYERIGRLVRMHANKREAVEFMGPGEIAAVVGLKTTSTGDTLCDDNHPILLNKISVPEGVISMSVEPRENKDRDRLSETLARIMREDPTFRAKTDESTGQMIISGMGELHLEIIRDRLFREFKVEAQAGVPQIAYRETITAPAEGRGLFKKQSGGRGQADCHDGSGGQWPRGSEHCRGLEQAGIRSLGPDPARRSRNPLRPGTPWIGGPSTWTTAPRCGTYATRPLAFSAGSPNRRTDPTSGRRKPRMALIKVDFPEPLGPRRISAPPGRSSNERARKTGRSPLIHDSSFALKPVAPPFIRSSPLRRASGAPKNHRVSYRRVRVSARHRSKDPNMIRRFFRCQSVAATPLRPGLITGHKDIKAAGSPVVQVRAGGGDHARGHLVQIEPRMSLSGAAADEWVPAKTGTEGILALGLAHHIVASGLYRGSDADEWRQVLAGYTVEKVAAQTDLPADTLEHLAESFVKKGPSLAIGGDGAANNTNGVDTLVAINALNYLAGNIGRAGGVLFNPEPAGAIPHNRQANFRDMMSLAEAARGGEIEVLIVNDTNPVFTMTETPDFAAAMSNIPLIVSLSSFMDETTAIEKYGVEPCTLCRYACSEPAGPGADNSNVYRFGHGTQILIDDMQFFESVENEKGFSVRL